jgi:hypothetical protein
MSVNEKITCVFRRPRFPLICDFDGNVFAVKSLAGLQRRIAGLEMPDEKSIRFCDANGESWMLLLKEMILAPDFPMKKWRIRLFNESRGAKDNGLQYRESVIPNRRLDEIVNDVATLLSRWRGTKPHGRKDSYALSDEK